jgi:hypothetical protein
MLCGQHVESGVEPHEEGCDIGAWSSNRSWGLEPVPKMGWLRVSAVRANGHWWCPHQARETCWCVVGLRRQRVPSGVEGL